MLRLHISNVSNEAVDAALERSRMRCLAASPTAERFAFVARRFAAMGRHAEAVGTMERALEMGARDEYRDEYRQEEWREQLEEWRQLLQLHVEL